MLEHVVMKYPHEKTRLMDLFRKGVGVDRDWRNGILDEGEREQAIYYRQKLLNDIKNDRVVKDFVEKDRVRQCKNL